VPLEAPETRPRPRLHYILVYPFRRWTTGYDEIVLASLLTSISSQWEEQVSEKNVNANRNREHTLYTFSLRYTELSWKTWLEPRGTNIGSMCRVRSTLGRWKDFAEKHQMEVLDGYGIDIRDVDILSEGLDDSRY